MLSLRIAARFLRKSPAQSILIAAGIAIGIGVQVFLGSLITSLQTSLVDQTIGSSPQLIVQAGKAGAPLDYTSGLQLAMKNEPQITTVVPTRSFSAIYKKGAESAPLQFVGGQLAQLDTIYDLSGRLTAGKAQLGDKQVMVGKDFAAANGLKAGDVAAFVLPDGKPAKLTVSGVFDFGSAAANSTTAFVDGAYAAGVLGLGADQYTAVDAQVSNVFDSKVVAESLGAQPALSGLKVTEWQALSLIHI